MPKKKKTLYHVRADGCTVVNGYQPHAYAGPFEDRQQAEACAVKLAEKFANVQITESEPD